MKHLKKTTFLKCFVLVFLFCACGPKNGYTLTGIHTDANSFQVKFFQNHAAKNSGSTIEPGVGIDFTNALQNSITNLSGLNLTNTNGDLLYEGEIVEYRVSPMSATANQTAAQNRLTMSVNVRFFNRTKEDSDFEQRFSFFFDFPGSQLLESVKSEAHEVLFERITQDIFNASLADW